MNNTETFMQEYERHRQILKELGARNKTAVFDALVAANITEVHVEFDGEGDSGQIEMATVVRNGEPVPMPEATVTLRQASFGSPEPIISESSLREGIETLCYDFLEDEHGGWENNDGAFGEFRFDVVERTVELTFHGRFTDVSTFHHSF
jgi:uncharacterized protein DUF6878